MGSKRMSDAFYLARAYEQAARSPDPNSQNGAVTVHPDGTIVSYGCNTFPAGVQHTEERWQRPLKYEFVCHAEVDACLSARTQFGLTLVCVIPACPACCSVIIKSGIKAVVGHQDAADVHPEWKPKRDIGMAMLAEAGIPVRWHSGPVPGPAIRIGGVVFDPTTGRKARDASEGHEAAVGQAAATAQLPS